jgi:hypothetical protein
VGRRLCNYVTMKYQQTSQAPPLSTADASAWFAGRIPEGWFSGPPTVVSDGEEILVVGTLPDVELAKDAGDAERATARGARITGWREDTREQRIRIALDAEHRFGRKVSWGAQCGDVREHFTTVSMPVMTRLRMQDRAVLDTLIDAGVARSRSEALAWCVRLVGKHQSDWIQGLRDALSHVEKVRAEGPETA